MQTLSVIAQEQLHQIARERISSEDPAHDYEHACRVLKNCETLVKDEGGSMQVLMPAALLHDVICYPKHDVRSRQSSEASAKLAREILSKQCCFDQDIIERVAVTIQECSFSKRIEPSSKESKVLQDADKLESTGLIALMRTFAYAGVVGKALYHPEDPFCTLRDPDGFGYALDLYYSRMKDIPTRLHTGTAKRLAELRNKHLEQFLDMFEAEYYQK